MQKSGTYRRLHDLQFRTEAEMVPVEMVDGRA
jgi:hypothetical protein